MASHPVPERLFGFAAKLEAVGGTPEAVSKATNAIRLAASATIEGPLYVSANRREGVVTGSLAVRPAPAAPKGRFYRIRGSKEVQGYGAAYSAANLPPEDPILVAAGFSRAVVTTLGAEKVTYAPSDDPNTGTNDVMTVEAQTGNREYILTNAVTESLQLSVDANGIARWEFSIVGIYNTDTEQALEAHTYSTVAPAIWANASPLSIGGVTSIIGKRLVADWRLQAAIRSKPDAVGIAGIRVTQRDPLIQLTAETLAKATWDPEADRDAVTQRAIDVTIGATQYARVKLDADAAYVAQVARTQMDSLSHFEVDYDCTPHATAALSVVFD